MYDHSKQYRCTIIRGKSQQEVDNLLPAYAKVIDEICPCLSTEFPDKFNNAFKRFLPEADRIKKTLDNHRTEIAGKLFGMYYFAEDNSVYETDRTQKFLNDNDQPAFFKDMCYKMQFPNGMQKGNTVIERKTNNISIRPNSFVLAVLKIAKEEGVKLTKKDIGYYVLNSLDVLQGKATPLEVVDAIAKDKQAGIIRDIVVPGKASSYTHQHINEQLNYLELANLILIYDDGYVSLNVYEEKTIDLFIEKWNCKPEFDVYLYPLDTTENKKDFQFAWDSYYGKLSEIASELHTEPRALSVPAVTIQTGSTNTIAIGDEGEDIVFQYEKQRVTTFDKHLSNRVLSLGKTRGLGYDIQSVVAEPGDFAEFAKYIEVKTTKRVTIPDVGDSLWVDTLNITRNEWLAAQQHKEFYHIFRVYMARNAVVIFVLSNVAEQLQQGTISSTPTTYRLDFGNGAVNNVIFPEVL